MQSYCPALLHHAHPLLRQNVNQLHFSRQMAISPNQNLRSNLKQLPCNKCLNSLRPDTWQLSSFLNSFTWSNGKHPTPSCSGFISMKLEITDLKNASQQVPDIYPRIPLAKGCPKSLQEKLSNHPNTKRGPGTNWIENDLQAAVVCTTQLTTCFGAWRL